MLHVAKISSLYWVLDQKVGKKRASGCVLSADVFIASKRVKGLICLILLAIFWGLGFELSLLFEVKWL